MYRTFAAVFAAVTVNAVNIFPLSFPFVSEVDEDVYAGSRNGTFTTVSRVTLAGLAAADDGADVTCRARHPAAAASPPSERGKAMEDTVELSVLCE